MESNKKVIFIRKQLPGCNLVYLVMVNDVPLIWKPVSGQIEYLKGKILGRVEFELFTFKVDRILGLGVVPVTYKGSINGEYGILQQYVDGVDGYIWNQSKYIRSFVLKHKDYFKICLLAYLVGFSGFHKHHIIAESLNKISYGAPYKLWSIDHTSIFYYGSNLQFSRDNKVGKEVLKECKIKISDCSEDKLLELVSGIKEYVNEKTIDEFKKRFNLIKQGEV